MKYSLFSFLCLCLTTAVFSQESIAVAPTKSLVSYADFLALTKEVEAHRAARKVDLDAFLAMSKEDNTIILDTRSKEMYDLQHIEGAIHLSFTDFTHDNLRNLIPDVNTRILIYCNNNFEGNQLAFASKVSRPIPVSSLKMRKKPIMLALNVPTYINLYGYGYDNIYELDELVHVTDDRVDFGGYIAKINRIHETTKTMEP